MIIDKITFKDNQAWIVIRSENGDYLGTWHTTNSNFVEALRKENPKFIKFGFYVTKEDKIEDEEFDEPGTEEFGGRR